MDFCPVRERPHKPCRADEWLSCFRSHPDQLPTFERRALIFRYRGLEGFAIFAIHSICGL